MTVLLLTHPGGPVVLQTLDALSAQHRLPDRVVITGLASDDDEIGEAQAHPLIAEDGVDLVVREPVPHPDQDPPLWSIIEDARAALATDATHWIWILHDDSVPGPEALSNLVEATRRSSGVGIVGPKLVRADDPRQLVSVGHRITRGGRDADAHIARELDQGQHDQRVDIIGVPLPGLLVRSDVLHAVGGIDKAFGDGAEGLDLSWRSHLAGHRVVVATDAVVRQGSNGHPAPTLTTRRRTRQMALARGSWWAAPWRALGILITSVLMGLGLLLVKRPQQAAAEFADTGAVLAPARGTGARWRFRGRKRVRRRNLSSLFAPASSAWHGTSDTVHGALTDRGAPRGGAALETGPVSEDAESLESAPSRFRTLWSWPLVLALLVAVGAALVRWRELLPALSGRGYGVTGGEVHTISGGWSQVWHSWADPWTGSGLGSGADPGAWLLPMSGFTWVVEHLPWVDATRSPAAVTVAWLLFAAIPLSVASAYFASRVAVRARWPRALIGLIWAGMAPLSAGVDEGRLGPVIAHAALPLIVAGVVVAGSRRHGVQRTTATFATVLLTALVGLFAPALLLLTSLGGLLVLLFGPGWGRLRGLLLAVLPWLLTGPWLREVLADPRTVLGGAGTTVSGGPDTPAWQTLLLHAGGSLSPTVWWTVPLLVLAVGATLRRGHRGRRAAGLLIGALLGLAAALAAPLVHLGVVPAGHTDAGEIVTAWPGLFLSVAAACLLLAAAQAVELPPALGRPAWHAPLVAVLTGVVAVAGVGTLAWTVWAGAGGPLTAAARPYPAVVDAQATGPEASRVLDLTVTDDTVTYQLVGEEPGLWVRDRVAEMVRTGADTSTPDPGEQALTDAVLALTDTGDASDSSAAHDALLDLGVGHVGLRAEPDDPLVASLDATAALSRVNAPEDLMLWRVGSGGTEDAAVPSARARLVDSDGTALAVVPVDGPHSVLRDSGEPPEGTAALVISEAAGWAQVAEVRAGGERLEPVSGQWPPQFAVTAGAADQLQVTMPPPDLTWRIGTVALAALVLFLALPFGSRRRRSS
ncbi:glycosyltransferase [Ornithinimicrobium faecis]|uniref:Glycosyltransferase n=1 Tax=Ornithinimicrobium faecis TaxID=2934158 RepID=A0ABY4YPN2_9MICO|nr:MULTISPECIES: glycosyltransferase [unclassified Ornithinimicrobium]USQ78733.1 glycosyltransferase [Ornithinimicrobium sp. HY1793]